MFVVMWWACFGVCMTEGCGSSDASLVSSFMIHVEWSDCSQVRRSI